MRNVKEQSVESSNSSSSQPYRYEPEKGRMEGGRVIIRMPVSGLCLSASIRQHAQSAGADFWRAGQSVRCSLCIGPSQEAWRCIGLRLRASLI
jgi:hypothetical protein